MIGQNQIRGSMITNHCNLSRPRKQGQ